MVLLFPWLSCTWKTILRVPGRSQSLLCIRQNGPCILTDLTLFWLFKKVELKVRSWGSQGKQSEISITMDRTAWKRKVSSCEGKSLKRINSQAAFGLRTTWAGKRRTELTLVFGALRAGLRTARLLNPLEGAENLWLDGLYPRKCLYLRGAVLLLGTLGYTSLSVSRSNDPSLGAELEGRSLRQGHR